MKVAIIADLHGNYQAWDAVKNEIIKNDLKTIFCLGDLVGYYFEPIKIFEELLNFDLLFIKGNHEIKLLDLFHGRISLENINPLYRSSYDLILNTDVRNFITIIESYSINHIFEYNKKSICLCHATPFDSLTYVYPNSPDLLLDSFCDFGNDFFIWGHTHYQFGFCYKNKTFINPGSVGQSKNFGGIANWAILDLNSMEISFKSTKYDRTNLINSIKKFDSENQHLLNFLYRNN